MKVTCAILVGGQVSIRLDGVEVYRLPKRRETTLEDLEKAFNTVLEQAEGGEWE